MHFMPQKLHFDRQVITSLLITWALLMLVIFSNNGINERKMPATDQYIHVIFPKRLWKIWFPNVRPLRKKL